MQITSRHLRSVIQKSAADNEKSNSEEEAEIELKNRLSWDLIDYFFITFKFLDSTRFIIFFRKLPIL